MAAYSIRLHPPLAPPCSPLTPLAPLSAAFQLAVMPVVRALLCLLPAGPVHWPVLRRRPLPLHCFSDTLSILSSTRPQHGTAIYNHTYI